LPDPAPEGPEFNGANFPAGERLLSGNLTGCPFSGSQRGHYLMPGLGEMHAHLPTPTDPPEYMRTTLMLYLANGVTTVRCMFGYPNHLATRQEVSSGQLVSPSLFLAGPGLSGGHVPNEVGIGHALESGQGTIEHLDGYDTVVGFGKPMPDELIKQLALETRESGAWSTPTERRHGHRRCRSRSHTP